MMTRDPGDDLWAQTFDCLAPEPSLAHLNADTKGDFLELTLAAAAQVLDCAEKPCSEPLMRCLHAARLLIEICRAHMEELQLWGNPLLLRVTREIDGRRVSCKSCPKCGGAVFGQWRYRLIGRRRSACLLRKKCPRRVRNWKQACPIFSGPARVELGTGDEHVGFFPSCPCGVPRKVPQP